MSTRLSSIVVVALVSPLGVALAQEPVELSTGADGLQTVTHQGRSFQLRYERDMARFAAEDGESPGTGGIVVTGSSTIVRWRSLVDDFAPLPVVNRGFGGSTSPQLWYYADRAVLPRQPKVIVAYIGDNDLVRPEVTIENYLKYVRLFVGRVRLWQPETRFLFLSNKPSVGRFQFWDKYLAANAALKAYCDSDPLLTYVDTTPPLLDENGVVREECFGERDKIHFKPEVYAEWTKLIKPVLQRLWDEANASVETPATGEPDAPPAAPDADAAVETVPAPVVPGAED